jgi:hypothetical protein
MDHDLPSEIIAQVNALSDYARKNGYAQITILPKRKAYFKRESISLLTRKGWENKGMAALRVVALLWLAVLVVWGLIVAGESILAAAGSDLETDWFFIVLVAPWLCATVVNGSLFSEGPEAKTMMNVSLFVAAIFISLGSIAKVQTVATLLFLLGVTCLATGFIGDLCSAMGWLYHSKGTTSS